MTESDYVKHSATVKNILSMENIWPVHAEMFLEHMVVSFQITILDTAHCVGRIETSQETVDTDYTKQGST